jgi:hypothetical protein
MAVFVIVPAVITYYSAAAVGTAIVGALGVTGLTAATVTVIGAATISAGVTAIRGGSVKDVLKSAVLTGVTAGIGSSISASVASDVAFDAIANSSISGSTAVAIGNTLGAAAGGAIASGASALLQGQDPIKALIKGGLTSGLSAGVNEAINFAVKDIPLLRDSTGNAAGDALQRAAKTALATSIVGGSGTKAFEASLLQSFATIGVGYLGDKIKDNSAKVQSAANAVTDREANIEFNMAGQQKSIDRYNATVKNMETEWKTQNFWKESYEKSLAQYEAMGGS